MISLKDRIVWVTGAGSGVGRATATLFASEGATVILTGRRRDRLEAVATAILTAGGRAHVCAGDLADPATSKEVCSFIGETFGYLDILINNAGHNIPDRGWSVLTTEGANAVISADLNAPFYCAIAALPLMRDRGHKLMIHTSSLDGRDYRAVGGPAYSASKHGVMALSHSLNLEEAKNGIRSSVFCPGGINTEILDKRASPPSAEQRAQLLQPEDVADLFLYIARLPTTIRIDETVMTSSAVRRPIGKLP